MQTEHLAPVGGGKTPAAERRRHLALLLSCDTFEAFFSGVFGLDREQYVTSYRNDFVWDYARGLVRLGHEVTVYILSRGPAEKRIAERGISVRFLSLPAWHRVVDAALFRGPRWIEVSVWRDRAAHVAFRRGLKRALVEDRIDVLYVQEFWPHRFDLLVAELRLPVIGADHGARFVAGRDRVKRRAFARASTLVCQDTLQLERACALGGRAVLITNGVDIHFFTPAEESPQREREILAVGRVAEEQKRFSDLLHALRELPEFRLTLIGRGPDLGMLRALAADIGVADRVTFAGFVSDKIRLRDYYRRCGVFVACSAWEAVALVMLEAMSCGAAVVGTRIPPFERLLEDGVNGVLVPVGAAPELAAGIRRAYAARDKLGTAARPTVQSRYASDDTYRALSRLIEAA